MKDYLCILVLALSMSLPACTTVKPHISSASFQAENTPVRELSVIVAYSDPQDIEKAMTLVAETSVLLEVQTGIRLRVDQFVPIRWEQRGIADMLTTLHHRLEPYAFDLAIGIAGNSLGETIVQNLMGGWEGAIDDTYRRYILIKRLDKRVLAHEICHAFILDRVHSTHGLMSATTLYLLPGVPLNESLYLTEEDRMSILSNKWRDFREMPSVADEDRIHVIQTRMGSGLLATESAR